MRTLRYLKCEPCKTLVWEMAGPLTCPKCGVDVILTSAIPSVIFEVPEKSSLLLTWDDDMWKVRRTLCLADLTARELNELLLLNPEVIREMKV